MAQTDFPRFKTYTWVSTGSAQEGQATPAQIQQALDAELAAKGLTKTDGRPDLLVECRTEVRKQQFSVATGSNMGMGVGGGVRYAPTTSSATETLKLYVYDAATNQLVWQRTATNAVTQNATPQKRQDDIEKLVMKLLKHFPRRTDAP